jgi:hypothetical protein
MTSKDDSKGLVSLKFLVHDSNNSHYLHTVVEPKSKSTKKCFCHIFWLEMFPYASLDDTITYTMLFFFVGMHGCTYLYTC